MYEDDDDMVEEVHTLAVHLTDEAITVLTDLDPFEHGIAGLAAEWVQIWCRGHIYFIDSVEREDWPATTWLSITVNNDAFTHLAFTGRDMGRSPAEVAATVINERARTLMLRQEQGWLLRPRPPVA